MKGVKINTDVFNEMLEKNFMTQADLAKKMGVSRCTICGYANGTRKPLVNTIPKLAKKLKCKPEELIIREEAT